MNNEKIAILVDSGTDVPKDYIQRYGIYVAPLKIIFSDCEYTDGVDVTPELLYKRFESEIPKTSLPTGEDITALLDQIKAAGYEKVLAITISSGLSGTYNVIDLIGRQYEGLEVHAVDTLNIAIASGLIAIQAAEDVENGMSWAELTRITDERVAKSKVYFCVKTLEYLQKGGRIGLVSSILGNALNLKPIIPATMTVSTTLPPKSAAVNSRCKKPWTWLISLPKTTNATLWLSCTAMPKKKPKPSVKNCSSCFPTPI